MLGDRPDGRVGRVHGPGGGSSAPPPSRARVTVPTSVRPLAVTMALDAVGAYPTAVTITVYAPGASGVASRTTPSASAPARTTCRPVESVTVTTACDTAHPSRVRTRALSPAGPVIPVMSRYSSPGWASSMSWSSVPRPETVRAVATGG
ncbi:hypothetical protein GCM10023084_73670 [Streptomyces lacrimifluminis]|uniref:Uncharacterized protein n=1 Tax=Streptomyces lacrimifluminis TaxID=1500077 RepID=A0A917UKZ0_9ACTN|nr:hypothetical protein GCM10012282_71750 [Streptomyces lacrimifluminis]